MLDIWRALDSLQGSGSSARLLSELPEEALTSLQPKRVHLLGLPHPYRIPSTPSRLVVAPRTFT